ncbi:hypothetical protein EDD37DRAFT_129096 [Exophiala viscosa]|uniref:uncharacterized protein n=1 Tax=Exophiala viscosa TaxID=2486360 RepID=UPI00219E10B6|nr:hypothetical protein EDD37DRAFT_129096 [Exophiala viscosa]
MPSPSQSTPPTRNTINQRASRARRKDYITELEQKVRDFETQGVQATEHVQRAARRVADENRALREEVQALRARNAELESLITTGIANASANGHGHPDYQHPSNEPTPAGYPTTTTLSSKPVEQHYPSPPQIHEPQPQPLAPAVRDDTISTTAAVNHPSVSSGPDIAHASSTGRPIEQLPHIASGLQPSAAGSDVASLYSYSGTIDDHVEDDNTMVNAPDQQDLISCCVGPNSTSCAQAAMIIASMRGIQPSDETLEIEILPQLGCGVGGGDGGCGPAKSASSAPELSPRVTYKDAQNCTVDNVRLFGILDQERSLT